MNLWKIYRWSFVGGTLGTISLMLPVRSFIASTPFLDAQQSQPLLVWGSLFVYVGVMVLTGFLVVKNSPAINKKQAALWGITGTVFASLILYSGLLASFAGFCALYKVFPTGNYPSALNDVQYTEIMYKLAVEIFTQSALLFWASMLLGILAGGLSAFLIRQKVIFTNTFFADSKIIPVSLVGVIYGIPISALNVSTAVLKNTLYNLEHPSITLRVLFTLQMIFPLLWLLIWQVINLMALRQSTHFRNNQNISGVISRYVNGFATLWQILLLTQSFNGIYNFAFVLHIIIIVASLRVSVLVFRSPFFKLSTPKNILWSIKSIGDYFPAIMLIGVVSASIIFSVPALNLVVIAIQLVMPLQSTESVIVLSDLVKQRFLVTLFVWPIILFSIFLLTISIKKAYRNVFSQIIHFSREVLKMQKERGK